jgi:hypothetical protein
MNPWDEVAQLRWQYEQRISEQLKAHEAHLAARECETRFIAWRESMERKGAAYRAYVMAVGDAVKSGIPRPNDS